MKKLIFKNSNKNIGRISALKVFRHNLADKLILFKPGRVGANYNPTHYCLPHPRIQKAIYNPVSSQKNFQGRNPYRIFVAILENQCLHKFLLSLSDLQLANFEVKSHSVPDLANGGEARPNTPLEAGPRITKGAPSWPGFSLSLQ